MPTDAAKIDKETLLAEARQHVSRLTEEIDDAISENERRIYEAKIKIPRLSGPSQEIEVSLYQQRLRTNDGLKLLLDAPYFFRCDADLQNERETKPIFLSKNSYPEKSIYSWTAPIAALRFEDIGRAKYRNAKGDEREATLHRKDNYTMAGGRITSMTYEDATHPRTLIYRERITDRKRGFVLPEIIAEMEKAQDVVIRSPYRGTFLIAGPAGSGKTTLALHKAAYLNESPDTAELFPSSEITVFVQDSTARDYFGSLLHDLGIHGVTIVTFSEWAMDVLGVAGLTHVGSVTDSERDNDELAIAKNNAIDQLEGRKISVSKNPFQTLKTIYKGHLNKKQDSLLSTQETQMNVDRNDLTALLKAKAINDRGLKTEREYYDHLYQGRLVKKKFLTDIQYPLVIVDEAENWTIHELRLIKGCVSRDTESLVLVGDLTQRSRLATINDWEQVEEQIPKERQVVMEKVYRNTKNILKYVREQGFSVQIPSGLNEGLPVEKMTLDRRGAGEKIKELAGNLSENETMGIIVKDLTDAYGLDEMCADNPKVLIMTSENAQGVEFNKVVLVNQEKFTTQPEGYDDVNVANERMRVNRNLLYVALTRAMEELLIINLK